MVQSMETYKGAAMVYDPVFEIRIEVDRIATELGLDSEQYLSDDATSREEHMQRKRTGIFHLTGRVVLDGDDKRPHSLALEAFDDTVQQIIHAIEMQGRTVNKYQADIPAKPSEDE